MGRLCGPHPSLWWRRLPPSSGPMLAPCNLHSRPFHGELRYPYAQWPIGHLILPTRCGCRPIRVAHPRCVVWVDERWLDEKSPNRFAPLRWSRSRLLGVKRTPSPFSPPRRIVLLAGARRLCASFSHGRGCRLSSTSWCPLLCDRGLGLGPERRDPLASGSTSRFGDWRSLSLVRERSHTTTDVTTTPRQVLAASCLRYRIFSSTN